MPNTVLPDLADFLDGKTLTIPIRGKKYVIGEATGDRFMRLQRMGALVLSGAGLNDPRLQEFMGLEGGDFHEFVLGKDVVTRMSKDEVPGSAIDQATTVAFFWHIGQGEEVLNSILGSTGKAPTSKKRSTTAARTTRTGAASTTRKPASGSGTSTRQN